MCHISVAPSAEALLWPRASGGLRERRRRVVRGAFGTLGWRCLRERRSLVVRARVPAGGPAPGAYPAKLACAGALPAWGPHVKLQLVRGRLIHRARPIPSWRPLAWQRLRCPGPLAVGEAVARLPAARA